MIAAMSRTLNSNPSTANAEAENESNIQNNAQTQRTKTGCQNCRLRHLKCDERRPSCARCEKSGIECVRGYNIRFRHGANPSVANLKGSGLTKTEYDFSKSQPWVRTNRQLTFLDETPDLVNIYDHNPDDNDPRPGPFNWPERLADVEAPLARTQSAPLKAPSPFEQESTLKRTQSSIVHADVQEPLTSTGRCSWSAAELRPPQVVEHLAQSASTVGLSPGGARSAPSNTTSATKRRRLALESPYHTTTSDSPRSLADSPTAGSWHTGWTPNPTIDVTSASNIDVSLGGLDTTVSQSFSRIYLDTPCWPLQDREEAKLLRHFVEQLARNFDLTDPRNHFRSVVPQRAALCPTLMNAIFALSARHLSRLGDYDPLISNKYHQECLKHLIPMLDDSSAILDENLLASTIILRHLEEFEVPVSGQLPADQHSHLLGAQAFIAAQERAAIGGGLRQAAFWVGLRQEVYVAFVNQRPVLPALEHCNVDRSFEAADDHIWSCRMVVLCADVIRYCFSEEPQTIAMFKYLEDQVRTWHSSKPATFTPVFYRDPEDDQIFPEIWFVGDEYATGIQHYHLSRILLSSHNPSIPRLGPGRAAALHTMDEEIRYHVRALCGMCRSNASTAPTFIYASMAITMAGDKFVESREQEALIEVLEQCDRMHAWPTGTAIVNLKGAWGWT